MSGNTLKNACLLKRFHYYFSKEIITTHSMYKKVTNPLTLLAIRVVFASIFISSFAHGEEIFLTKAKVNECPTGWVSSSAPGGCSPGFFTLFTNGLRDSQRSCPDGWVRSSAPGGCTPEFLNLKLAGLKAAN
jgi:hypothetical protein